MLWPALDRYDDAGLLVLRLGFGLGLFWYHGLGKLTGGREQWESVGRAMGHLGIDVGFAWWGFAAAFVERIGALLFAAGLFFRPTAALIAFVMLVATVQLWGATRGTPAHSFKNIWVAVGLIFIGPVRYSLDHLLQARPQRISRIRLSVLSQRIFGLESALSFKGQTSDSPGSRGAASAASMQACAGKWL